MLKPFLKVAAAAAIIIIPGSLGVLAVGWLCKKAYSKFYKRNVTVIWLCSQRELWLSVKAPIPENAVEYWYIKDITASSARFIEFEKECRTLGVDEGSLETIRKAFYPKGEENVSVH